MEIDFFLVGRFIAGGDGAGSDGGDEDSEALEHLQECLIYSLPITLDWDLPKIFWAPKISVSPTVAQNLITKF